MPCRRMPLLVQLSRGEGGWAEFRVQQLRQLLQPQQSPRPGGVHPPYYHYYN